MTDLIKAKEILKEGGYTCVFCKKDKVITSNQRGVKPLLSLLDDKKTLDGFAAADKVVGRAAAFLYMLLNVSTLHANTVSEYALEVLEKTDIKVTFDLVVTSIINRQGTGLCPMESAVVEITEPHAALAAVRKRLAELNS